MRICIVTTFPPEKGNLAEYGYYLVEGLAQKEDVDKIIVLANGKENNGLIKSDKVKVVRCWSSDDTLSLMNIIRMVWDYDPDLVFVNCHMMSWGDGRVVNFIGALLPSILKRCFGCKVVVSLHNIVDAVDFSVLKDRPSRIDLFGADLATRSMMDADKVVVTLKSYVKLLQNKYKKSNLVHIPHATWGKKSIKNDDDGRTLLSFGFWRDTKDLPLLLDSFIELREKYSDLKLIVAGQSHPNFPRYLEDVRERYGDIPGVEYTGYVPDEELDYVFGLASLVVLPYLTSTGSSGVVHLSASYGKPVVMTDMLDMRKMVEEEGLKILFVPKGDKDSLKRGIEKLLKNKRMRDSMIKNNLMVAEELSFDKIADKYVEVFEKVLE